MTLSFLTLPAGATDPLAVMNETTILFTHDLHSHFLPVEDEEGGQSGGYARLKTAIDQEKELHPDALVLDAGDFSIGTLFQTLYTTQAAELRTMAAMGYDAVTMGNHEFDHKGIGFAQMLNAAVESGDPLPGMVCANYRPAAAAQEHSFVQQAMDNYGVQETMLLQRGGVTYGIFGLMGVDSDDCAPTSGFELEDPAAAAKRCVAQLKEQGAEFIICLSHSGTDSDPQKSEDEQLAKNVEGIDVIVSGHTHTTLCQPTVVNGTYIVSAGNYGENLGSITLQRISDGSLYLAGIGLKIFRNVQHPQDYRNHGSGQQIRQSILHSSVLIHFKISENTVIEFSLIQSRLQIDQNLTVFPFQVGAGAEDRRPGNTEMGKQKLPEIFIQEFTLGVQQLHAHISQAQALHPGTGIHLRFQGNQGAFSRNHRMTETSCHIVSIPCRTCGRIRYTAGCQDHPTAGKNLIGGFYAGDPIFVSQDLLHTLVKHPNPMLSQLTLQALQDRSGPVCYREHSVPPFCFQLAAILFKKGFDLLRGKGIHGAI